MIRQLGVRIGNTILQPNTIATKYFGTMTKYPGLGLELRHFPQGNYGTYPLGIHGNCYGGDSDLLPVREVAMLAIMDKLTDKSEWHKKVFDDNIVARWRKEALEYPDDLLWKLATGGKVSNRWASAGQDTDGPDWGTNRLKPLKSIMSTEAFEYVSITDCMQTRWEC